MAMWRESTWQIRHLLSLHGIFDHLLSSFFLLPLAYGIMLSGDDTWHLRKELGLKEFGCGGLDFGLFKLGLGPNMFHSTQLAFN